MESEPKQLWTAGTGAKNYRWWNRSLKFGFRYHRHTLLGKASGTNNTMVSLFNGPNRSGAGPKTSRSGYLKRVLGLHWGPRKGSLGTTSRGLHKVVSLRYYIIQCHDILSMCWERFEEYLGASKFENHCSRCWSRIHKLQMPGAGAAAWNSSSGSTALVSTTANLWT